MNHLSTQAWLIRVYDYKEADRIGVFLTADFGKITCFLRGIKKTKSKIGKTISLLNLLDISIDENKGLKYLKESRILFSLSESKKEQYFALIHYISELTNKTIEDNQSNPEFFIFLKKFLRFIETSDLNNELLFIIFSIQVLKILGFGLNLEHCHICEEKLKEELNYLSDNLSGISCPNCYKNSDIKLQVNSQKLIKLALNSNFRVLSSLDCSVIKDITLLKNTFLRSLYYHLGINLKSVQYLEEF